MTSTFRACVCAAIGLAVAAATARPASAAGDVTDQVVKNRRDLISAGVSAPTAGPGASAQKGRTPAADDLTRAIERIQRISLVPEKPADASESADGSQATQKAPAPAASAGAADERSSAQDSAPTPTGVSDAVLDEIKQLGPDKIADPLSLADILYQAGRLAEAAPFYQKAYDTAADAGAKAWALFQMGNCRRQTDPAAALTLYKRITTEFPKSPWKAVADTECKLIEWRQSIRPASPAGPAKTKPATASAATGGLAAKGAPAPAEARTTTPAPAKDVIPSERSEPATARAVAVPGARNLAAPAPAETGTTTPAQAASPAANKM